MFNRKLKQRIAYLEASQAYNEKKWDEKCWALRHDLDRLIEALHLTKQEIPYSFKYVPVKGKS